MTDNTIQVKSEIYLVNFYPNLAMILLEIHWRGFLLGRLS